MKIPFIWKLFGKGPEQATPAQPSTTTEYKTTTFGPKARDAMEGVVNAIEGNKPEALSAFQADVKEDTTVTTKEVPSNPTPPEARG